MNISNLDMKRLDTFIKGKKDIIVTSTTIEFIEMCNNWYTSLKKIGMSKLVVVFALDKKSYDYLLKKQIFTILLNTKLTNKTAYDWIENEKKYKPVGPMFIFKNYKVNVIHLDTDIVFLKKFLNKLKQECRGYDLVMCSDKRFDYFNCKREYNKIITVNYDKKSISDWGLAEQVKFGEKNGAVFYLPHKKQNKILKFFELHFNTDILKNFKPGTQEGDLQTITNKLIKEKTVDLKIKVLDVFKFPNGSIWQVPYLRDKIKNSCYLVHYNYYAENAPKRRLIQKIAAMKKYGHWFL